MASGQVHFKFMSARQYDSISFDGGFVSVGELKRLIAARKSLSAEGAAELLLSDPETRAEYRNDAELVPKNTSVLVKRAPAARGRIPGLSAPSIPGLDDDGGPDEPSGQDDGPDGPADELFGGDLYSATPQEPIVAVDEEKAINELISGSASAWQKELASGRGRGRGRGRGGGRGGGGRDGGGSGRGGGRGDTGSGNVPPPSYRCHRCEQGGHYISDCPTNGDPTFDVKRVRIPVGIPMTRLARDTEGGLMLPNGETGALLPNTAAFMKEMAMLPSVAKAAAPTPLEEPPVPAQSDPIPSPAAEDASAIADKNLSAPVEVHVEVQKPDKGGQPSPTEGEGGKGETGRSPGAEASASNEKPVVAPPPPPPKRKGSAAPPSNNGGGGGGAPPPHPPTSTGAHPPAGPPPGPRPPQGGAPPPPYIPGAPSLDFPPGVLLPKGPRDVLARFFNIPAPLSEAEFYRFQGDARKQAKWVPPKGKGFDIDGERERRDKERARERERARRERDRAREERVRAREKEERAAWERERAARERREKEREEREREREERERERREREREERERERRDREEREMERERVRERRDREEREMEREREELELERERRERKERERRGNEERGRRAPRLSPRDRGAADADYYEGRSSRGRDPPSSRAADYLDARRSPLRSTSAGRGRDRYADERYEPSPPPPRRRAASPSPPLREKDRDAYQRDYDRDLPLPSRYDRDEYRERRGLPPPASGREGRRSVQRERSPPLVGDSWRDVEPTGRERRREYAGWEDERRGGSRGPPPSLLPDEEVLPAKGRRYHEHDYREAEVSPVQERRRAGSRHEEDEVARYPRSPVLRDPEPRGRSKRSKLDHDEPPLAHDRRPPRDQDLDEWEVRDAKPPPRVVSREEPRASRLEGRLKPAEPGARLLDRLKPVETRVIAVEGVVRGKRAGKQARVGEEVEEEERRRKKHKHKSKKEKKAKHRQHEDGEGGRRGGGGNFDGSLNGGDDDDDGPLKRGGQRIVFAPKSDGSPGSGGGGKSKGHRSSGRKK